LPPIPPATILLRQRHFIVGMNVFKIIPARAKGPLSKWLNGAPEGFLFYVIASRTFAKKSKKFSCQAAGVL
jgi:hypothetical protein